MKYKLLDILVCPNCGNDFKLKVGSVSTKKYGKHIQKEVKNGMLVCKCRRKFPIINFIPRILPRSTREKPKKQVRESFTCKWGNWQYFNRWYKKFFDDWFMKKIGLTTKKEFGKFIKTKKMILDAGTGIGPKLETIARLSSAEIFGVDISDSVEQAYENTKVFPNVHIIQADIFNLPFKKNVFDFVISDGVLHHTPDAKKAFLALCKHLSSGGKIAIHVYKRMGPIREFSDDYVRAISTNLSFDDCYKFCKQFTKLGRSLHNANMKIEIPQNIDILGIKKGKYDLQRFIYYTLFQCFWNPNLSFRENNLVNLDWLHPVNASRHTEQEVVGWFKKAGLINIRSFKANISGVSIMGKKK